MIVSFQGGSDDLVEIKGFGKTYGGIDIDEINVIDGDFSCDLESADGQSGVRVGLIYEGTWDVVLGRLDEGVSILPMRIELTDGDRDYNIRLTLDVPSNTRLRRLRAGDRELADVEP